MQTFYNCVLTTFQKHCLHFVQICDGILATVLYSSDRENFEMQFHLLLLLRGCEGIQISD